MPSTNDFVQNCYLNRYPDLAIGWMYQSGASGTKGKWIYGKPSNRPLKKLSDNLLWHWQNFGQKEGRVAGCDLPGTIYDGTFNAAAYVARYPDIRSGIDPVSGKPDGYNLDPYSHYLTIGAYQGRKPGFEIITPNSPQGVTSPGTVKIVQGNTVVNTNTSGQQGDLSSSGILQPIDPTLGQDAPPPTLTTTPAPTSASVDAGGLVSANSLEIGVIILAAVLFFTHKKKKKK